MPPQFSRAVGISIAALLALQAFDSIEATPTAYNNTQTSSKPPTSYGNGTQSLTGLPPCDALIDAGLSHAVYLPENPRFQSLVDMHWAKNTRRSPYCFVMPSSVDELVQTLAALGSTGEDVGDVPIDGGGDWHIAVRSGGHASDYSNNIDDGVTIDLSQLNATSYNKETNLATVGTGARWQDVYEELEKHGVQVTGGRNGVVGVGGFLLGGGNSWYTAKTGFGCDSIIRAEVVLASGQVINANASSHPDLWKALKGGGANFGIVTKFDIEAFPARNLSMTTVTVGLDQTDALVDVLVGFDNLDQSHNDNALLSFLSYNPKANGSTVMLTEVNTNGNANSTAFHAFNKIPALIPQAQKWLSLPEAAVTPEYPATLNVGALITFANDPKVLKYSIQQHEAMVSDLKTTLGPNNFTTLVDYQPFSEYFSDISLKKGGNMLGLERDKRNKWMWVVGITLTTPEAEKKYALAYQKVNALVAKVDAFAKSVGSGEEFIYLNYAHANQDVLGSYGEENVEFIRKVARKYDPFGFFQRRVNGGFKISRVR